MCHGNHVVRKLFIILSLNAHCTFSEGSLCALLFLKPESTPPLRSDHKPSLLCCFVQHIITRQLLMRSGPMAGDSIALEFFTPSTFLSYSIFCYNHEISPHCDVEGKKGAKHLLSLSLDMKPSNHLTLRASCQKIKIKMNLLTALAKLTPWHKDAWLLCPVECNSGALHHLRPSQTGPGSRSSAV